MHRRSGDMNDRSSTMARPFLAPITTSPFMTMDMPSETATAASPTNQAVQAAGPSRTFTPSLPHSAPQHAYSLDSPLTLNTPSPSAQQSQSFRRSSLALFDDRSTPARRSSSTVTSAPTTLPPLYQAQSSGNADGVSLKAASSPNRMSMLNMFAFDHSSNSRSQQQQHRGGLLGDPFTLSPTGPPHDAARLSSLGPTDARRRPLSTLTPREATHSPSFVVRTSSVQAGSSESLKPALPSFLAVPGQMGGDMNEMTAWQFLSAEPDPIDGTPKSTVRPTSNSSADETSSRRGSLRPSTKGKQRAEVPIMELRIVPMSDSVNMFGSTQTSSNYSLSGKVIVRVHNVLREVKRNNASSTLGGSRRPSNTGNGADSLLWLPEISTGTTFLNTDEFFASHADISDDGDDAADTVRVQEINVMSLSCTFSGYALYVDHSGRFAACRLAEVSEELLPQGFRVSIPEFGKSQEYEMEFTISIPGWLPGSLLTRFGGTFYGLEARAKYTAVDSEQQHAIPSSLVPPRTASILPDAPSNDGTGDADQTAVPLRWQRQPPSPQHVSDEEAGKNSRVKQIAAPKSRAESTPPPTPSTGASTKSTWLSKRAKQLSIKTKNMSVNGASSSAPSPAVSRQSSLAPTDTPTDGSHPMPPKLYASRDHIRAFSDPTVIVVRRCREVVPVPVARMAIVGSHEASNNPIQDAPTSTLSQSEATAGPSQPLVLETAARSLQQAEASQDTLSPAQTTLPGPPVAPTTFDVPGDPAKAAAHVAAHPSAGPPNAPPRTTSSSVDDAGPTVPGAGPNVPMRHFLHRPMLHPPAEAKIPNVESGLPFSLTLSLPSYVAVDGPGSDILNFGVQIEVGRSSMWARVRELGGLRLRDMELSCIQTERHCSVPSRTFCHAYPLPPEPRVSPFDLPVFPPPPIVGPSGRSLAAGEVRQRRGYDRGPVQHHMELLQAGKAPHPAANNVERLRTVVVGPPPSPTKSGASASRASENVAGSRGKEREASRNAQRRSMHASPSGQNDLAVPAEAALAASTSSRHLDGDDFSPEDMPNESGSRRGTGRGRRAYQSAIRGLSNFATAVMDISFDLEGTGAENGGGGPGGYGGDVRSQSAPSQGGARQSKAAGSAPDATRAALYSFAGSDGHGVDLTRGRVRMAIKLPLVTSSGSRARNAGTPQLIPDFESPFTKTRHKLQVKLGFGFGSKPLGGEGEWGQSLVMCVPVRFTDSAPREVREQFAPQPIQQVALGESIATRRPSESAQQRLVETNAPPASVAATSAALASQTRRASGAQTASASEHYSAPVLPSYNQLFREDGSRLADEGEDLPQYPGPRFAPPPSGGSVTGPSAAFAERSGAESDADTTATPNEGGAVAPPLQSSQRSGLLAPPPPGGSGSLPMTDRSSSLPGPSTGSKESRMAMPDRLHSYDNRIAPSHVVDESIPADKRGKMSRAMQRAEMEEMHRDEQEARRLHRLSTRIDTQAGVSVSTDRLGARSGSGAGDSGQEGELSDADGDGRLLEETVNVVDEMDAFDDDMPAFAAAPRPVASGQPHGEGGSQTRTTLSANEATSGGNSPVWRQSTSSDRESHDFTPNSPLPYATAR